MRDLKKASRQNGLPNRVTIDKRGANTAAPEEAGAKIGIRQTQCLDNWVEQVRSLSRQMDRPAYVSSQILQRGSGNPARHRAQAHVKKARMITVDGPDLSAAERFYSLAA